MSEAADKVNEAINVAKEKLGEIASNEKVAGAIGAAQQKLGEIAANEKVAGRWERPSRRSGDRPNEKVVGAIGVAQQKIGEIAANEKVQGAVIAAEKIGEVTGKLGGNKPDTTA